MGPHGTIKKAIWTRVGGWGGGGSSSPFCALEESLSPHSNVSQSKDSQGMSLSTLEGLPGERRWILPRVNGACQPLGWDREDTLGTPVFLPTQVRVPSLGAQRPPSLAGENLGCLSVPVSFQLCPQSAQP